MASILFISELYYPEETSTGYILTVIAEGLSAQKGMDVRVLCSQPTYSRRGEQAAKHETRNGVRIRRLAAPGGDKNRLPGRLWNALSLTLRFGWAMLFAIKRGDRVLVVTNPPSLPLLVGWIGRLKRAKPILIVHDVYPDVLVPTGLTRPGSALYRIVDTIQRHMLRRMEHIVVLGRDMETRIAAKLGGAAGKLRIIPNWGDVESVRPTARIENPVRHANGLDGKFVIQLSGNLGRTHGLDDFLSLAEVFLSDGQVHFMAVGWGAGKEFIQEETRKRNLKNVTLLPRFPRNQSGVFMTCCDLFYLPFKPGMEGISVPSRMYNVMAAGNPMLAVCAEESELAMVVREEQIGFVVEPGDLESMERCVREAMERPEALRQMGARARIAVERKYTWERVVAAYGELLREVR